MMWPTLLKKGGGCESPPINFSASVYNLMRNKTMRTKPKQKIYAVYWQDAVFSFRRTLPKTLPPLQLTFGIVIESRKEYLNIATNCQYDRKKKKLLKARDGFLLPRKTIISLIPIGYLNEISK
jgi:hypothetical protein